MELFTLGIGNYTEADIREAARAFTGWRFETDRAVLKANEHDPGEKAVLGQRGRWGATSFASAWSSRRRRPS